MSLLRVGLPAGLACVLSMACTGGGESGSPDASAAGATETGVPGDAFSETFEEASMDAAFPSEQSTGSESDAGSAAAPDTAPGMDALGSSDAPLVNTDDGSSARHDGDADASIAAGADSGDSAADSPQAQTGEGGAPMCGAAPTCAPGFVQQCPLRCVLEGSSDTNYPCNCQSCSAMAGFDNVYGAQCEGTGPPPDPMQPWTKCRITACSGGFGDCDGNPLNGCEADLSQPSHCGSCMVACGAGQACAQGQCVAQCAAPLVDCNGQCVDVAANSAYCDACPQSPACPAPPCSPPRTACSGRCVDLTNDAANCGSCGHACSGAVPPVAGWTPTCVAAACAAPVGSLPATPTLPPCPAGQTRCSSPNTDCVDLQTDPWHCGSCNSGCQYGCDHGQCAQFPGLTYCPAQTTYADLAAGNDPINCGSCGTTCPVNVDCFSGKCVADATTLITNPGGVQDFAVDADGLYWIDSNQTIHVADKLGMSVKTFPQAPYKPLALSTDAANVYWANSLGGAIMRLSKGGGMPSVLTAANQPGDAVVAGDGTVYWLEATVSGEKIRTSSPPSYTPTDFASDDITHPLPHTLAVDDAHVYVALNSRSVLLGGGLGPAIARFTRTGTAETELANCVNANNPFDNIPWLRVDATGAYFVCQRLLTPAAGRYGFWASLDPSCGSRAFGRASIVVPSPDWVYVLVDSAAYGPQPCGSCPLYVAKAGIPWPESATVSRQVLDVGALFALDDQYIYWVNGSIMRKTK